MKKRKIGILTQPLMTNYGGLLQNYALQKVLKDMGHDVETIRSKWKTPDSFLDKSKFVCRQLVVFILKSLTRGKFSRYYLSKKEKETISKHTDRFIHDNINTTSISYNRIDTKTADTFKYDAYIVGSDQVWRPCYSPFLSNFFLDFLSVDHPSKKIAYAASFGVDEWEFTPGLTEIAKQNISKFDLVTVREYSGINLCKTYLSANAEHVLDPTLLLRKEDYIHLICESDAKASEGNLMTYVLDQSPEKQQIIDAVAAKLGLKAFKVMPNKVFGCKHKPVNIKDYVYPSVEQWIRGFLDAKFVVTDSFHGTVFSIIFNKPFIAIGNKGRGLSRFTSLLRLFNLENRLIYTIEELDNALMCSIDYSLVNSILEEKRLYSQTILRSCLN